MPSSHLGRKALCKNNLSPIGRKKPGPNCWLFMTMMAKCRPCEKIFRDYLFRKYRKIYRQRANMEPASMQASGKTSKYTV
jgi:hypothetical protein